MHFSIRPATIDDAEAVTTLAEELNAYIRSLGDKTNFTFSSAAYVRDGFGGDPAFYGLVAENEGVIVGYLLYHFAYDTDHGRRLAYIADVYVQPGWRGHGIGKALMRRAAEVVRERGVESLWWGVYKHNESAFRFYESLGAQYLSDIRFMSMDV